jgi:hypothetical protein
MWNIIPNVIQIWDLRGKPRMGKPFGVRAMDCLLQLDYRLAYCFFRMEEK